MLLIFLLAAYFHLNLVTKKYPNHVISVNKRDTLNIQEIYLPCSFRAVKLNSSIDLSKLELLSKSILKYCCIYIFIKTFLLLLIVMESQ